MGKYSDNNMTTSLLEQSSNDGFLLYTKRWWILAMFCSINFVNALMWVTFAPISDISQHYFGHKVGSITAINMLAIVFQAIYAPGTLYAVYVMKRHDLRYTLILGGSLTVVGAFIRLIGTLSKSAVGDLGSYLLIFLGQVFGAIAQPMYVNMPAVIASVWFSPAERDHATTLGALFSPLGNALGTILPVLFVSESQNDDGSYHVTGMSNLMLAELILCLAPLIVVYFYFESEPKTPPSHSTKMKKIMKTGVLDSTLESQKIRSELNQLLNDRDYVLLLVSFSVGLGIFTTVMTLINQIVEIHGYSNDDAGVFGAVLIVCGLVGAGIAGFLMEKTHKYREILKGGFTACSLSMLFLVFVLKQNNYNLVLFAFALLGFFILPMLPAVLENCAECTYPVSEDLSTGLLFVGGNVVGIGFIFLLQITLPMDSFHGTTFSPANCLMFGLVSFSTMVLMFYKGKYKRLQCEILQPIMRDHGDVETDIHTQTTINGHINTSVSEPGHQSGSLGDDALLALVTNSDQSQSTITRQSYLRESTNDLRPSDSYTAKGNVRFA